MPKWLVWLALVLWSAGALVVVVAGWKLGSVGLLAGGLVILAGLAIAVPFLARTLRGGPEKG